MKKNNYLIAILLFLAFKSFGQSAPLFSREDVQTDLDFLHKSLKDTHYNLFAYSSEQTFDSAYFAIKNSIKEDSLNLLTITNYFQKLVSKVNNSHTEIDFPGHAYIEYANANGTVFPLEIAFEQNKSLVRKNWSDDKSITVGSEILSIDGKSISEILRQIYPQISAERPYFKMAKIEQISFPRYYWQVFGKQDEFEVEVRADGVIKKHSLKSVDLIEGYETKRDEILNAQMNLVLFKNSAYLNPGDFSGDELKYRQFIDSSFVVINQKKYKNLVIDLRNNAGGNNPFSDYLISYFAHKPFKWSSRFTLKSSQLLKDHVRQHNDTTDQYWKEVLDHKNGEIYEYDFGQHQPKHRHKRFLGTVYVLVNRQSYSQSAVTAAQIQDYNFGIIVGEETGEYPSLFAARFQYKLPNTGLQINVAKGFIVRINGSIKQQGVVPNILIRDHLLDENDEILDSLLKRIDDKN